MGLDPHFLGRQVDDLLAQPEDTRRRRSIGVHKRGVAKRSRPPIHVYDVLQTSGCEVQVSERRRDKQRCRLVVWMIVDEVRISDHGRPERNHDLLHIRQEILCRLGLPWPPASCILRCPMSRNCAGVTAAFLQNSGGPITLWSPAVIHKTRTCAPAARACWIRPEHAIDSSSGCGETTSRRSVLFNVTSVWTAGATADGIRVMAKDPASVTPTRISTAIAVAICRLRSLSCVAVRVRVVMPVHSIAGPRPGQALPASVFDVWFVCRKMVAS
jgi:hypothetical protein